MWSIELDVGENLSVNKHSLCNKTWGVPFKRKEKEEEVCGGEGSLCNR